MDIELEQDLFKRLDTLTRPSVLYHSSLEFRTLNNGSFFVSFRGNSSSMPPFDHVAPCGEGKTLHAAMLDFDRNWRATEC